MNKFLLAFLALSLQVCSPAYATTGIIGKGLYEGVATTATAAGTTTLTVASDTNQIFTGSTTQTLVLPNATTFPRVGRYFWVDNRSSGAITVNKNGGALLTTVPGGALTKISCTSVATAAGEWSVLSASMDLTSSLVSGVLPLSKGGTEKNLTAVAGGLIYSDADSMEVLAAGTSGYLLQSNGTSAPSWLSTIPIANGGTGQTTANAALNALLPSQGSAATQFLQSDGTNTSWATAALTAQGQDEGSGVTTTTIKVPHNQLTTIGTNTRLFETGNGNILANPGFEHSTGGTGWSAIAWDGSSSSGSDSTSNNAHAGSLKSYKIVANTDYSIAFIYQDQDVSGDFEGQLLEHGIWYKSSDATMNFMWVCPRQNDTTIVGLCQPFLNLDGKWDYAYATSIGPAPGTSIGIAVYGTANMLGTTFVDNAYTGLFRRDMEVMQPFVLGTIKITGCAGPWSTSSTTLTDFGTQTGCTYTATGSALAPSSNLPAIKFASIPPGELIISYEGSIEQTAAAKVASFQFSDGTNTARELSTIYSSSTTLDSPGISQSISYTTAQSNVTLTIKGLSASGGSAQLYGTTAAPGVIKVLHFPSSRTTVQSTNAMRAPTYTTLTSGSSATYTVPAGVARLEVLLVGGGGGGAGSGTAAGAAAGDGTGTVFGSSTAGGGTKGAWGGGTGNGQGGTNTIGSDHILMSNLVGSQGGGAGLTGGSTAAYIPGGHGGVSCLLGAGTAGSPANASGSAVTNSGSGGAGGGSNATGGSGIYAGSGGGSGGCLTIQINNPASTYTYTVGAAGTAGAAGASGNQGGAGGSGRIIIKEIYGVNVPPMKAGVIASTTVMSDMAQVTSLAYGTYSATITNISNTASITQPDPCTYTRVGNIVNAGCLISTGCTTAAATDTTLNLSLPVTSNFTGSNDLTGVLGSGLASESGRIYADTTNDRAQVNFKCQATSAAARTVNFQYIVK